MTQLEEKLAYARGYAEEIGRTKPLTICMGRFGGASLSPSGKDDVARAIDDYGRLAEAGVSWATISVPAPSRAAFIENVHWFGEEIAAKVR